jgi:hypothetical protein
LVEWFEAISNVLGYESFMRIAKQVLNTVQYMTKSEYQAYLESDHWKSLRRQKLEQSGYKCSKCGSPCNLQVHHLRYRSIYNVKLSDLEVLCQYHHLKQHGIETKLRPIKPDTKFLLKGVFNVPVKQVYKPWNPNRMTPEQIREQIKKNKANKQGMGALMREKRCWDMAMGRDAK